MEIPASARDIMRHLRDAGYEARLVGGCVRDMLSGCEPQDWDICTSATPEQMLAVFAGERVIPTGLKHGTLTVLSGGVGYEVTSYRTESGYSDARHPDRVAFVRTIDEDLARRDFTINAMAWDEQSGLIDLFGGADDLARGIIRCVGDPAARFGEDALRMLRALRFAARFDFVPEPGTAAAIHALKARLHAVSGERIFAELRGLLSGRSAARVLREFADVVQELWPGAEAFGDGAPSDETVRLALLMRGAGAAALDGLRCESALKKRVRTLWEAEAPQDDTALRRAAVKHGAECARQLAAMHGWEPDQTENVLRTSPLSSLRALALHGEELQALGYEGAAVGAMLEELSERVLCGRMANGREPLLAYARRALVRKRGIEARRGLTPEQRAAYAELVCGRIRTSAEFRQAHTILLYRAVGAELSLDGLMNEPGKRFCYPRCMAEGGMIALSPGSESAWECGAYGICEPTPESSELIAPEEIGLVICPCTAFDDRGGRMGMGAGYYDRYLPRCRSACIAAAAFEVQRAETVPAEPWDVFMEKIFTEENVYENVHLP